MRKTTARSRKYFYLKKMLRHYNKNRFSLFDIWLENQYNKLGWIKFNPSTP